MNGQGNKKKAIEDFVDSTHSIDGKIRNAFKIVLGGTI